MTGGRAGALVLRRPRELERHEIPLPEIGDDDGILRVEACGLCGTDHEEYTGHLTAPYSFIPGHEVVGVVEAWPVTLRSSAGALRSAIGSRSKSSCPAVGARRAWPARTVAASATASATCTASSMSTRRPGLWGGYATHLYLGPDALLLPVPAPLDPVLATVFNPLGAGLRWAVEVPDTQPGDVVVVLGPGVHGLAACAAAKAAGAGFVMVTGVGPATPLVSRWHRNSAPTSPSTSPWRTPCAALRAATAGLADVVIDVTAKAPTAPGQALQLARPSGTIVLAGTRGTSDAPGFDPDLIVYKEIRVLGALGVDAPSYRAALDLLATAHVPVRRSPSPNRRLRASSRHS